MGAFQFISCLIIFVLHGGVIKADNLLVSVYYETLCPDSIEFIRNQLYPVFTTLESYLHLDLVPFGNAEATNTSGHWEFVCQHGPNECYGNKVHSCIIEFNSSNRSVEFINCAMGFERPNNIKSLTECAKKYGIPWDSVEKCLSSGEADILLAENGIRTHSVTPKITFVPTITFNNIYNQTMQDEAEKNFLKIVCDLLQYQPAPCKPDKIVLRV